MLHWEGGYANDDRDVGGETNWGISKHAYPNLDIKALTLKDAITIYQRDYWQPSGADGMDWPLCLTHMDAAVNMGVGAATGILNSLDRSQPLRAQFLAYNEARRVYYRRLRDFTHWGRAWLNRVDDCERVGLSELE